MNELQFRTNCSHTVLNWRSNIVIIRRTNCRTSIGVELTEDCMNFNQVLHYTI